MPGLMKPVALDVNVLGQLNESYRLCATCLERIDENAVQSVCCFHFTHQECFRVQFIYTLANKRWRWEPTDMKCGLCRREWKLSSAEEEDVCTLLEVPFVELMKQQQLYFESIWTPSSYRVQALQAFPLKCTAQVLRLIRDKIQNEVGPEMIESAAHRILFGSGRSSVGQKWRAMCKAPECLKLISSRLGNDQTNLAALDIWLRFLFNRDTVSAVLNDILSVERCPVTLMNQTEPLDLTPIIRTQMLKFGALLRESGGEAATNGDIAEDLLRSREHNVSSRKDKEPEPTMASRPAADGQQPSARKSSRTATRSTLLTIAIMIFVTCLKECRWLFHLFRKRASSSKRNRRSTSNIDPQQTDPGAILI